MTHHRRRVRGLALGAASIALLASPLSTLAQDEEAPPAVSDECQAANLGDILKNPGRLTLSTDNPSFPPWWGGEPVEDSGWEVSYPPSGEGYEGGVAYAVAAALGFAPEQIDWLQNAVFELAFQPGPKDFDWHMAQISIRPERAENVDFSDPYFDANQALVGVVGTDIESAASIADLKDMTLGAAVATTSLQFIEEVIQPTAEPQVYNDNAAAIQALQNEQIDGIVVDLNTAFFVVAVQLEGGTIVGQFPVSAQADQVGMVLEKGSPLTACVNEALQLVRDSGQLQEIFDATITTAQDVPVLE
jgi:polar amino acid transport system substrate-binding protein